MKKRNIEVHGNTLVRLTGCKVEALETLPVGLKVAGDFALGWRKDIISLPSWFRVAGNVGLADCTNLKSLPFGLMVGGFLNLTGCENINDLPLDLLVAGIIYYDKDTGFARDPEKLKELEMRFPGKLKKS